MSRATKDQAALFLEFSADITEHVVTVLVSDGVRRHLRCRKPGTYCQSFDILTWSGHLCYTGDMGTYVFSRIEDMFEFFRTKRPRDGESVNFSYWAEKVIGEDRDGVRVYSEDLFRAEIKRWFADRDFDSDEDRTRAWEQVELYVLSATEHEHDAVGAAMAFEFDGELIFQDFWEVRVKDYTPRYTWCCYALQWAIERFDRGEVVVAADAPSVVGA